MSWVIIGIVVVVAIAVFTAIENAKAKKQAKKEYESSLQKLKQDPTNPDLRERTLHLGRQYANLMRNSKGQTIFDEVALMNDINAACARATVAPQEEIKCPYCAELIKKEAKICRFCRSSLVSSQAPTQPQKSEDIQEETESRVWEIEEPVDKNL